MTADLVSGEGHFLVHIWGLLVVFSHGGGGWFALWGLFHKSTNPVPKGSTIMSSSPPKTLLPNTITLGVRIST